MGAALLSDPDKIEKVRPAREKAEVLMQELELPGPSTPLLWI